MEIFYLQFKDIKLYNFIKKDIDFTVKNGDTRTIIYTNVSSTDINKK